MRNDIILVWKESPLPVYLFYMVAVVKHNFQLTNVVEKGDMCILGVFMTPVNSVQHSNISDLIIYILQNIQNYLLANSYKVAESNGQMSYSPEC